MDTGQRAGGAPPRRKGGAEIKMLSEKDMQTQQRRAHLATINHPGVRGGITDTGEERYGYGSGRDTAGRAGNNNGLGAAGRHY